MPEARSPMKPHAPRFSEQLVEPERLVVDSGREVVCPPDGHGADPSTGHATVDAGSNHA